MEGIYLLPPRTDVESTACGFWTRLNRWEWPEIDK